MNQNLLLAGASSSRIAEEPTNDLLKDLPDLTVKARDRIWAKSENARLRLRRAQRQCLIDDPFRSDSGGRCLDQHLATQASTEYGVTYFAAIADEYKRLRKSYQQLCKLLTNAIRFVDSEILACWKGLSFDDQMTFASACLPKVRRALRDEKDGRLEESLEDVEASLERSTPTLPALARGARKGGVQIGKGFVNLTDQQKDLLRLLVSKHQSNGGQPFLFVRSHTGAGLCYPGGDSLPAANDELDFHQLQRENLITLDSVGKNQWRGKPAERGITAVNNGFSVPGDLNTSTKRSVPVSKVPAPRKPLGGIEDPPMHTVRTPNVNFDDCPSDFDDTERDEIKAAELRATRVIAAKQSSIRSQAEGDSLLVKDWILPIFAAFSKLAFNRVEEGTWPIHKADVEAREFTRLLTASAGMNSPHSWMAGGRPTIRAEIWHEIENSPEWKRHQDKLLDLIGGSDEMVKESEHESPKGNSAAETISERGKRRQEFLDPILKNKLMSVNSWADAASAEGLAHSTVFRYYNGEVSPRIDTLQKLASPLGLKAEDLPN